MAWPSAMDLGPRGLVFVWQMHGGRIIGHQASEVRLDSLDGRSRGLASTGDPRMNAPWTALGTPAISVPMPVSNGLPLGLQLSAEHGKEARLLRTAVRLQTMLGSETARVVA